MKIVYFGSDQFSCSVLTDSIAAGFDISLVVTTLPRHVGRGLKLHHTCVETFARDHAIPCLQADSLKDEAVVTQLADVGADLFVVVSFGAILPDAVLSLPRIFTINVHPSLLPRWRGASPMQSALLHGDQVTGVSIIELTSELDGGDVLGQEEYVLDDTMNAAVLEQVLAKQGAALLARCMHAIRNGTYERQVQDRSLVTYARKFKKTDGAIDWSASARDIHNQVRALVQWPQAYTSVKGKMLKVFETRLVAECEVTAVQAGTIVAIAKEGCLRVQTGDGVLDVLEVQVEGKKRMNAHAFSLGMRVAVGDVFGG